MSHCKNFKAFMVGTGTTNTALLVRARCKLWACDFCCERNRKQWQAAILEAINTKYPDETWYFATITAHSKKRRLKPSLKNIQRGFSLLSKRMARYQKKQGLEFIYVRVYEQHKDGSIHMHLITNFNPLDLKPLKIVEIRGSGRKVGKGSRWLSDNAAQCGMGYMTQIERIENANAGKVTGYITKYMTKQLQKMPKNIRRVQTSRHIKLQSVEPSELNWTVTNKFTIEDFLLINGAGYDVLDISNNQKLEFLSFDDDGNLIDNT